MATSMAQAACPQSPLIISLKVFQQLAPQSAATNGTRAASTGTQSPSCGARELSQGSAPSLVLQVQVQPEGALSPSLKQDFRPEIRPSF